MERMKNNHLLDWINKRSIFYLEESLGPVESEIRDMFRSSFSEDKTGFEIYKEVLPLSFAHLRLLSGLTFDSVFQDLNNLKNLFYKNGPEIQPGTLYLLLTSLSSTPGKLSSLAVGRDAFFSLLTVRFAKEDLNEEQMINELKTFWKIQDSDAISHTIERAKNFSKRNESLNRGLKSLSSEFYDQIANFFPEYDSHDYSGYTNICEHVDFSELVSRVNILEYAKNNLYSIKDKTKIALVLNFCNEITGSMKGFLDGILPWEKELITFFPPIFDSMLTWASRLRLLDEGESPIAYPGRERLPDWITKLFENEIKQDEVSELFQFFVGMDTYFIVGINANSRAEYTNVRFLAPHFIEDSKFVLRLVFGGEIERKIIFDLNERKEFLCAMNLLQQRDIRLDIFVQDQEKNLRFGVSRYLEDFHQHITEVKNMVSNYMFKNFDGDKEDMKIAILEELSK
ncbi:MAG: hypothetical protein CMH79_03160 [Nitrospinae bacterium]|nr:hypothetical protein [Nitrospinota bacterium]|tara:strand:- start:112 stop:1476 length:1365 start_codon:yes stop_codon:yes gene_type:complete